MNDEKVKEITERLEQGVKDLFESERYKEYLRIMSKFHNYSFNNSLLISLQKPDATYVAGYTSWQANFHRTVNKGEKGIRILAPCPYKIYKDEESLDPVTGKMVKEKVPVIIPAYKVTTVFDISQTTGQELPEIVYDLKGSVLEYDLFYKALKQVSPVPIEIATVPGGAKGYYHLIDKKIVVHEGMSQTQTIKTVIHELAHAKLHDKDKGDELDRNTKEVQAESVAYTVCQHFGIDTSDYSFGYIAGWSSGRSMEELKQSMNTIRETASDIISGISRILYPVRAEERQQEPERKIHKHRKR